MRIDVSSRRCLDTSPARCLRQLLQAGQLRASIRERCRMGGWHSLGEEYGVSKGWNNSITDSRRLRNQGQMESLVWDDQPILSRFSSIMTAMATRASGGLFGAICLMQWGSRRDCGKRGRDLVSARTNGLAGNGVFVLSERQSFVRYGEAVVVDDKEGRRNLRIVEQSCVQRLYRFSRMSETCPDYIYGL